jgi:Zn-dependent peptidase ImmA (M78 family)
MRVEQLLLDLAERFGVSASFIEYRLHRYALVQ